MRVANVIGGTTDAAVDDRYNRTIADDDLAWTLGSAFRTPQEYESRLAAMGGPSAGPQRQFMSHTAVILRGLFEVQTAATMFNTLFTG